MDQLRADTVPRKVLIVKPSALGDVVHSLPFLHAMRNRYPAAEIHWVIASALRDLLETHSMIDRLWVMDKDRWRRIASVKDTLPALARFFSGLYREHFDMVVDLQGLFRSGVISAATRAKLRIGFKEAREGSALFYTHKVAGGRDLHAVDRYLRMAEFLGCATSGLHFPFPPLPVHSPVVRSLPDDFAVIAPAAGGEAKKWFPERFGEVAARLPVTSIVVAGSADAHIARRVAEASKGKAVSLAGRTSLGTLAAIIRRARFMLCVDTGPMHIAAALNVPVIALFGPTNPARTGPYGDIHTIIREDIPCSPCYRRKRCSEGECMKSITVDRVMQAVEHRFDGKLPPMASCRLP